MGRPQRQQLRSLRPQRLQVRSRHKGRSHQNESPALRCQPEQRAGQRSSPLHLLHLPARGLGRHLRRCQSGLFAQPAALLRQRQGGSRQLLAREHRQGQRHHRDRQKAEDSDDVVIRAYETWNKTTDCVYTFDRAPKSVYVCNLLEENEEQLEVARQHRFAQIQALRDKDCKKSLSKIHSTKPPPAKTGGVISSQRSHNPGSSHHTANAQIKFTTKLQIRLTKPGTFAKIS